MDVVVDSLGLVREGGYLTVFVPPTNRALVFRVKSRANVGREVINYGSLPVKSGETLPTYEGGTAAVPADGVLPGRSYTGSGRAFPLTGAYDETDMWYVPEDYRDRVFHVRQFVTPAFLRVEAQIPVNVTQGRFQKERITTGVDKDFGFSRGCYELIHVPKLKVGYRYGNDTNLDVKTFIKFVYAEYVVEIPRSPEVVLYVVARRIPSLWVSMPVASYDPAIRRALLDTYGFEGFPVFREDERERALSEYESILGGVKV